MDHQPATYSLQASGAPQDDDTTMTFNPRDFMEHDLPPLARPAFLAITASNTLAATIIKKANGRVDGLVIEGPTAGGHNAPPRGKLQLNPAGEPIYGERDKVDLVKVRELGLPFWLAGEYGSPEGLREALASGAAGVQVGTPFAFCVESGLAREHRRTILASVASGTARVLTDSLASPTHFPFKIVQMEGSLSDYDVYSSRRRICDLGYLREAYRTPEGAIGYRCAAEPVATYVAKGGKLENTVGTKCLCNALLANIGLPQVRSDKNVENGLITAGYGLAEIARFLPVSGWDYSAADVVRALLHGRVADSPAIHPLDSEGVAVSGEALMPA
jgi:nitronate monooxygenase